MTPTKKSLLHSLSRIDSSVSRQIISMLEADGAEIVSPNSTQTAAEVLSLWSVRLWNAMLRGRRITGLKGLVRSLSHVSPDSPIQQVVIVFGDRSAQLFLDIGSGQMLGGVLSSPNHAAAQRNISAANQSFVPAFLHAGR